MAVWRVGVGFVLPAGVGLSRVRLRRVAGRGTGGARARHDPLAPTCIRWGRQLQLLANHERRATTGCFPTTTLGVLLMESQLENRQRRFRSRLLGRPGKRGVELGLRGIERLLGRPGNARRTSGSRYLAPIHSSLGDFFPFRGRYTSCLVVASFESLVAEHGPNSFRQNRTLITAISLWPSKAGNQSRRGRPLLGIPAAHLYAETIQADE